MKRIVFLSLILLTLLSACRYKNAEEFNPTDKGKLLFDYAYYPSMEILDNVFVMAFNFNAWYEADADKRDEIENLFFKGMTILKDSIGCYRLYEKTQCKYIITTHGEGLQSVGNQWDIQTSTAIRNYYGCEVPRCLNEANKIFHVKNLAEGKWQLLMDSTATSPCSIDWMMKVSGNVPTDLYTRDFSLTGKAHFVYAAETSAFGKETIVDYDMVELLKHQAGNSASFDEGKWEMTAAREDERDLHATATFLPNARVNISYRDKTEAWSILSSDSKY